MDPLFHVISGVLIAKMLPGDHVIAGVIATNVPDILSVPYAYGVKVGKARKDTLAHFVADIKRFETSGVAADPSIIPVYQYSHSLFVWVGISIFMYLFARPLWPIITIGHLFHILADIPSHQGDYATRLFYPISQWHVPWGRNWTSDRIVFFGMWAILLFDIILLYFSSRAL